MIKNFRYSKCALILAFFVIATFNVKAADYVTVATIGVRPHSDNSNDHQAIVNNVIAFWRQELQQVFPYKPDLILLTETCDLPPGLSKGEKLKYLTIRKNQVLDFFASVAKTHHTYIAFGMERLGDDGMWRNSSVLIDRNGKVAGIYDKNYPTDYEMEAGIKAGNDVPVFECDFGRVASAICFDLNFDELKQKYISAKPDIILFSSMYHGGDALQSSWAYSCRSFFIGSCAGGGIPSEIRNPLGDIVASNTNYFNHAVSRINLDYKLAHLDHNWDKLRSLKEKYKDSVTVTDPGKLGAVLITSEHPSITAAEMIKEFKIELLDDYFDRSRKLIRESVKKKK